MTATIIASSISWFLYLASVSDKLGGIAGFFGSLLAIISVVGTIIVCIIRIFSVCAASKADRAEINEVMPSLMKMYRWFVICGILCGVVYSIMPAKETLYAMAAAEVGEKIVTNEKVQGVADEATQALQAWLKKQIENNSTKEKKSD